MTNESTHLDNQVRSDDLILGTEEIRAFYRWITNNHTYHNICFIGHELSEVIKYISEFDNAVKFHDLHQIGLDELNSTDLLICSPKIREIDSVRSADLLKREGAPESIVIVFPLDTDEVSVPEVSVWLWDAGYVRNLPLEYWVNDNTLAYAYKKVTAKDTYPIWSYEAEVSRLTQLSQKRRLLLQEYREQIYGEILYAGSLRDEKKELENRWTEFQNSRTGRAIQWMQKARQVVLPSGGFGERVIRFVLFSLNFIRREGLIRYIKAFPSRFRLAQRIRWQFTKLGLKFAGSRTDHQVLDIEPLPERPQCTSHVQSVDIIVCVHNALDDVSRCLDSVGRSTSMPYNLILVDDGSNPETKNFLADYAQNHPVKLFRNDHARGYTLAANQGLRESKADFVILLNSDTIVTKQWLDRMICCANSDPQIGIVGPLSNTASWQSVPKIEDQGDWAENPLPEDVSEDTMANWIAESSVRIYPEMPLLNGFCLMIKRMVIEQIGIFDEENFGAGYGEEDDYAIRARQAGWKLALADDVYIYHAQSKSYSNERRKTLSERSQQVLHKKHGAQIIQESVEYCHRSSVLEGIRARAEVAQYRNKAIQDGQKYAGKSVLFLMPVASPGGGANVIRYESLAMMKMGVKVEFYNLPENREKFFSAYPNLEVPTIFGSAEAVADIALDYDAVIATYNPTVQWMESINQFRTKPVLGYYVQGFEPYMYPPNSFDYLQALRSYSLFPGLAKFTKTEWTRQKVYENTGQDCRVIGVSADIDLFRPRPREESSRRFHPLRVAAMIRPESPYRQPYETMQLLKKIADEFGSAVEICIFGTSADNQEFLALPRNFRWRLYGVLPQQKVANFLSRADIFIDYSSHQAMGLTALEAMACGCAVVVPRNGGADSFCVDGRNSIIIDTTSLKQGWDAIRRLIDDHDFRSTIQRNAIHDVCAYFPERAALNILNVLFEDV